MSIVAIYNTCLDFTIAKYHHKHSSSGTGTGIPADKQLGIFDKFTQADSNAMRKYGGTEAGVAGLSLIADNMELGKTVPAIAAAEILAQTVRD